MCPVRVFISAAELCPLDCSGRAACLLSRMGGKVLPFEWFLAVSINAALTGMALSSTEATSSSFALYNMHFCICMDLRRAETH